MTKHSLSFTATALVLISGVASAQNQTSGQDEKSVAPAASQSTQSTQRSPATTLPETKTVAPDATGAPIQQTGQAPNVSKKKGPEMDSAGEPRPSPDEN
jgi:hypothetical protein